MQKPTCWPGTPKRCHTPSGIEARSIRGADCEDSKEAGNEQLTVDPQGKGISRVVLTMRKIE